MERGSASTIPWIGLLFGTQRADKQPIMENTTEFVETVLVFLLGYAIAQLACSIYRLVSTPKGRPRGGFGEAG